MLHTVNAAAALLLLHTTAAAAAALLLLEHTTAAVAALGVDAVTAAAQTPVVELRGELLLLFTVLSSILLEGLLLPLVSAFVLILETLSLTFGTALLFSFEMEFI